MASVSFRPNVQARHAADVSFIGLLAGDTRRSRGCASGAPGGGRTRCSLRLRPPDARRGRFDGQHLSGSRSRNLRNVLHAAPLGRYQEQSVFARPSEGTGETAAVTVDCLQHVTAFADAHAALVGYVAVPDSVVGVDADSIRDDTAQVGPHPPVRQATVSRDVKGGELL